MSGIQPLDTVKVQAFAKTSQNSQKSQKNSWSKDQNYPAFACVEAIRRSDHVSTGA